MESTSPLSDNSTRKQVLRVPSEGNHQAALVQHWLASHDQFEKQQKYFVLASLLAISKSWRNFFGEQKMVHSASLTPAGLCCRRWNRSVDALRSIQGWIQHTSGYFPWRWSQRKHVFVMLVRSSGQTPAEGRTHRPTGFFYLYSCLSSIIFLVYFCFNLYHKCRVIISNCLFGFCCENVSSVELNKNSQKERQQCLILSRSDLKVFSYDASGNQFVIRLTFWWRIVMFW